MLSHLRACLLLTVVSVPLCCIAYPLVLLGAGKLIFPQQAEGSLLERDGNVVGSKQIAQPFTDDKYFHPRPSAVSYNGAASGATNWSGSNYLLRNRVAQQLGPIVKYAGPLDKKGKFVGPDIEAWFQKDKVGGQSGIVAQWANLHNTLAQNWVKSDMSNGEYGLCGKYVQEWQTSHKAEVDAWIKDNPGKPEPKPEDLAVPFFVSFSKDHPGTFPSSLEHKTPDGKSENRIEPVKEGSDIQKIFFDLWLGEHADVELEKVPADMVMASGSGLDPHITLDNALWQLENQPIAGTWAKASGGDEAKIREEIKRLLQQESFAPFGGLVGVPLVNVLEVNLALQERYEKRAATK
jgi:potassium-transporting ATPase KdpC subunit